MRISNTATRIATCGMVAGLVGGLCLALSSGRGGLTAEPAFAFDGTTSPSTAALSPSDGLRGGTAAPDTTKASALTALQYAAEQGQPVAQWKLGRMYADGDGVKQDDLRAFEYFRGVADAHAEETPGTPQARFVANAFVALGNYYLEGIPDTAVKADTERAREMFAYAASYFGDPDAQYRLGRMYLDGHGGLKEPKQAARWLSLAARKGQYQAQAVLGAMLFKGEYMARQPARGLMWLTLARDGAPAQETWIGDLYAAAMKQATNEERAAAFVQLERWLKGRRE